MAMQIVMDRTGDSRHHFDPRDAGGNGAAVLRADESRLHRRGAERSGSGLADLVVRSERGRNRVLAQVGRRLIGRRHAALQAVSPN